MLATFRFKSGQKIVVNCESVSIKHHEIDGSFLSYEISGIVQQRGREKPLYMCLKEIESVTTTPTKFHFFERFFNVFIRK